MFDRTDTLTDICIFKCHVTVLLKIVKAMAGSGRSWCVSMCALSYCCMWSDKRNLVLAVFVHSACSFICVHWPERPNWLTWWKLKLQLADTRLGLFPCSCWFVSGNSEDCSMVIGMVGCGNSRCVGHFTKLLLFSSYDEKSDTRSDLFKGYFYFILWCFMIMISFLYEPWKSLVNETDLYIWD